MDLFNHRYQVAGGRAQTTPLTVTRRESDRQPKMLSTLQLTSARLVPRGCVHTLGILKTITTTFPHASFRTTKRSTESSIRHFYTSKPRCKQESEVKPLEPKTGRHVKEDPYVYHGPLTAAFRRLKLFSLGSFGLATTLSPFILLIESNLPMNARWALASIALGTSGLSTSLVAWCAKPYVTTMHRFRPDEMGSAEEVELTTYTLTLQPRITKVCVFVAHYAFLKSPTFFESWRSTILPS